jgi:hypothetical protein
MRVCHQSMRRGECARGCVRRSPAGRWRRRRRRSPAPGARTRTHPRTPTHARTPTHNHAHARTKKHPRTNTLFDNLGSPSMLRASARMHALAPLLSCLHPLPPSVESLSTPRCRYLHTRARALRRRHTDTHKNRAADRHPARTARGSLACARAFAFACAAHGRARARACGENAGGHAAGSAL